MDTSETYIKMNERLPDEFPDKYTIRLGDWYLDKDTETVHIAYEAAAFEIVSNKHLVKLYRQDQLQEMFPKQKDFYSHVIFFRDMIRGFGSKFLSHQADSWEQLWLILVMR